jgi:hypothetical protein
MKFANAECLINSAFGIRISCHFIFGFLTSGFVIFSVLPVNSHTYSLFLGIAIQQLIKVLCQEDFFQFSYQVFSG